MYLKLLTTVAGIATLICLLSLAAIADDSDVPMPGDSSVPLPDAVDQQTSSFGGVLSSLSFSGYFENTMTAEHLRRKNHEILLNANRIRLNLEGNPDDSIDFGIGVVGKTYNGATTVSLVNYLPDDEHQMIDPSAAASFFTYQQEDDIYLQEMFGTIQLDRFRIRFGRHEFYTGTGYAYNPIDLFNRKNPLDPTYEVDGIDAVLLSYDLPSQAEAQALMRFSDRSGTSDYLLRLAGYYHGWDVALQYTHYIKERTAHHRLADPSAYKSLQSGTFLYDEYKNTSTWHLIGAEFSGEILGVGVYGEGGHVIVKDISGAEIGTRLTKDHERLLAGVDHTFDNQLYIMTEYLRLGQGCSGNDTVTLDDRMGYYSGETLAIDRNNLFSGLSYPLGDLIDCSLYGIIALDDPSAYINPWLQWNVRPSVNFSATCYIPVGEENTSTGYAGPNGFLRLKVNF